MINYKTAGYFLFYRVRIYIFGSPKVKKKVNPILESR